MDKTVIAELAATLATLRSAGETGFWILAVCMLVAIGIAAVALVNQRIVIGRFELTAKATEERFKGVDTQLKTIDTNLKERELGVKERDELRNIFSQQFSIVKDTNAELRAEMTRLRERQDGFEESVNVTISAGLQDVRNRLTQTSVKEIIAQVPDSFRRDLEIELSESLQAAIKGINTRLQKADMLKDYTQTVMDNLYDQLVFMLRMQFKDFDFVPFFPEWIYRVAMDETRDKYLAERLAKRFADSVEYQRLPRRW